MLRVGQYSYEIQLGSQLTSLGLFLVGKMPFSQHPLETFHSIPFVILQQITMRQTVSRTTKLLTYATTPLVLKLTLSGFFTYKFRLGSILNNFAYVGFRSHLFVHLGLGLQYSPAQKHIGRTLTMNSGLWSDTISFLRASLKSVQPTPGWYLCT